jgi:hypothetical protein
MSPTKGKIESMSKWSWPVLTQRFRVLHIDDIHVYKIVLSQGECHYDLAARTAFVVFQLGFLVPFSRTSVFLRSSFFMLLPDTSHFTA